MAGGDTGVARDLKGELCSPGFGVGVGVSAAWGVLSEIHLCFLWLSLSPSGGLVPSPWSVAANSQSLEFRANENFHPSGLLY